MINALSNRAFFTVYLVHLYMYCYHRQLVGWDELAKPNNQVILNNSFVGLHCVQHQLTVNTNFFDIIFKQSKLKSKWLECHQANLSKVLKTLQSNSVSYVIATQQGYVNNKLRKRKVSQIYISNNLNTKESL